MPSKINMQLLNGNASVAQILARNSANLVRVPQNPTSLNAPIISRIHNVKPGCGGCGRK